MDICILDSATRYCVDKVIVDNPTDFVPYKSGIEVSPRHDGEIGWILLPDSEWHNPNPPITWTNEQKIRNIRNFKLKQSDKYAIPDFPIVPEKKQEWSDYRQALRDITSQSTFPDSVVWPSKPA